MAARADRRGWGPGWPRCNSSKWVTVTASISGTTLLVHREVAPIVKWLLDQTEALGYLFDHGPKDPTDDWGAVCRRIAGTSEPSNHSWGLAMDLDATLYPQGQRTRRLPQWVMSLWLKYGFDNGVYWSNPDPMHMEFNGTPADARFLVASLAAHAIEVTQPPLPPSAPKPPPVFIPPSLMNPLENKHMLIELAFQAPRPAEHWLEIDHPTVANAAQHVCVDGDTITPDEYKAAHGFRRIDGNRNCEVWRAGHNEVGYREWKVSGR